MGTIESMTDGPFYAEAPDGAPMSDDGGEVEFAAATIDRQMMIGQNELDEMQLPSPAHSSKPSQAPTYASLSDDQLSSPDISAFSAQYLN